MAERARPILDGLSAIRKLGRSLVRYRDPQRYLNKVEIWSWVSMEDGRPFPMNCLCSTCGLTLIPGGWSGPPGDDAQALQVTAVQFGRRHPHRSKMFLRYFLGRSLA
jgi:hypothetical protein